MKARSSSAILNSDINLAMNGPPSEIAKRQTPSGSSERQDSNSQPVKTQAAPAPRYNVAIAGDRDNPAAAYHPVTQLRKPRPSWASLLLNRSRTSLGLNENGVVQMAKQPGASVVRSRFPDWWLDAWSRSITARLQDQFVGDRPFFPPCITSNKRTGKRPVGMLEPRNYHPSLKNPCWYKDPQLHDGLRCLPYFHVIGVATSGASDLIRRIRMHPDVMKGTMREFHWWDRGRFGDVYKENMPIDNMEESEGLSRIALKDYAYLITGSTGIDSVMADVNSTGKSNKIFGDNSPSYFNDVKYWSLLDGNQGCLEPRLTIGQHIRHTTPDAKIIVIVRHPTPRLYLRFLSRVPEQMSLKKTASFAFHRLVKKSVEMYRDCFSQWSIRQCAYNVSLYEKDKVKLWEGMYSVFLADWLRVFPAEQIHVLRYRDLVRDTNNVMANIFNFLNLPPLNATTKHLMAAEKWAGRREEHELRKYFGPMVPETVDMLNEFYDPFVDKFAELLNDEKFLWRDVDHL